MDKKYLLLLFTICLFCKVSAQKIDSIYVNLYTDSLKKGTYNYINIDGLLSTGKYIPLDSSHILFTSSAGKFFGNSLFVSPDFKEEKIIIHAVLRKDENIRKDFVLWIKKKPDNGPLKTEQQVLDEMKASQKKKG